MSLAKRARTCLPDEHQPLGKITLLTADGIELPVDKELLRTHSGVFAGLLAGCDTEQLRVEDKGEALKLALGVCAGTPLVGTYDTSDISIWHTYKEVLAVADKYDMVLVTERCEKWLVSRCLRGALNDGEYGFDGGQHALAFEWLILCDKFGLKDLRWYLARDLGRQMAGDGSDWAKLLRDCLTDAAMPVVPSGVLLAVLDEVVRRQAPGNGAEEEEQEDGE